MLVVIILGILSMWFAWLESSWQYKHGLKIAWGLIFLFLALRYNYASDYTTYLEIFREINKYPDIDWRNESYPFEIEFGWILLCWLCKPIGFFGMTAILALANCLVYYDFFKKYVPRKYYWFAISLYVFNPVLMLTLCSTMRQNVAILLFIFSINYIYNKNAIRYFLCIGLASLFHSSALILLPVYLLGFLNWKISKVTGFIIFSLYVSLFILGSYFMPYINQFISSYFTKYEIYQDEGIVNSGLGIAYLSGLFILTLYYARFENKENSLIFKIAIIYFMSLPLFLYIQLSVRIGMYFMPATLIVYPIIFMSLKRKIYKIIFATSLLLVTSYMFFQFFESEVWKDCCGTYQTILSAPEWY